MHGPNFLIRHRTLLAIISVTAGLIAALPFMVEIINLSDRSLALESSITRNMLIFHATRDLTFQ